MKTFLISLSPLLSWPFVRNLPRPVKTLFIKLPSVQGRGAYLGSCAGRGPRPRPRPRPHQPFPARQRAPLPASSTSSMSPNRAPHPPRRPGRSGPPGGTGRHSPGPGPASAPGAPQHPGTRCPRRAVSGEPAGAPNAWPVLTWPRATRSPLRAAPEPGPRAHLRARAHPGPPAHAPPPGPRPAPPRPRAMPPAPARAAPSPAQPSAHLRPPLCHLRDPRNPSQPEPRPHAHVVRRTINRRRLLRAESPCAPRLVAEPRPTPWADSGHRTRQSSEIRGRD